MLRKTELYLWGIALLGVLLNLFLIPYTQEVIILSLTSLSFLYLYFSFALLNNVGLRAAIQQKALKNTSVYKILGAIFSGGALSIAVIAMLLKIMYWPFATALTYLAVACLLIAGIANSVLYKKNKEMFYKGILIRIWSIVSVIFVLFMLPKDTLLNFKYRNNPEYLNAYKDFKEDSGDSLKIKKYEEELKKLEE